jgi:hypothetical protein
LGCSFCHAMITFFGSSAYVIINGCLIDPLMAHLELEMDTH